jgi:UDP:flavonoid glycosyltransferase YjiC (YdhE family)
MKRFDGARVFFSPCGMGLGHVSRCVPIANEIRRLGGEVMFSTYLEGVDYLAQFGFPVAKAPEIYLETDKRGSIDLKATVSTRGFSAFWTLFKQIKFEVEQMKRFTPDLVFVDTRVSAIMAARLLRIPCILTLNQFLPRAPREKETNFWKLVDGTVMTILGWMWALSDRLVIPDFPQPYTISLDSLRAPRRYGAKMDLVGSILGLKPEDNLDASKVRERLGLNDQILIYAGISGPRPERMPLIRMLAPIFSEFPDKYHVVMSMGNPHGGNEPKRVGNVTLIPWIIDRFAFLNACDVVISRGGHETIMQSIGYNKPSIIIPMPRHPEQYGNARRAMEIGVAEALHQRDLSKESLIKRVEQLLEDEQVMKVLVDMNQNKHLDRGLDLIIEIITEYL